MEKEPSWPNYMTNAKTAVLCRHLSIYIWQYPFITLGEWSFKSQLLVAEATKATVLYFLQWVFCIRIMLLPEYKSLLIAIKNSSRGLLWCIQMHHGKNSCVMTELVETKRSYKIDCSRLNVNRIWDMDIP